MKDLTRCLILITIFLILLNHNLLGQTTVEYESFEGTVDELGYTADDFSNGFSNYFDRISNVTGGTGVGVTYHINSGVPANIHDDGTGDQFFWGGDDIDDTGNSRTDDLGIITFNNVTVTDYTDLQLVIALTQGRSLRYEATDYIRIYYAFDGDITSHPGTSTAFSVGSYTLLAEFRGSGTSTDLSQNGAGIVVLSTGSFDDYTFAIPGTGNSLSIRIVCETDGGDEEILIDNIRVQGTAPVPVELTSFTAQANGNSVQLNWETATEVNNYGFEIERQQSENGTLNTEWETIGFVQGHGNSNSPKSYEFIDENAPVGNLKYRLKQIDTDGTYEYYSLTAEVDATITSVNDEQLLEEFHLSQNYPNPFNPTTTIEYAISKSELGTQNSEHVLLRIYDILGNEVSQLVNKLQASGTYQVEFDASNLPNGMYFYKLQAGDFAEVKKMLLIK